jgi:hypothetical protein
MSIGRGIISPAGTIGKTPLGLGAGDTFEVVFSVCKEDQYFRAVYPDGYVKHHDMGGDKGKLFLAIVANLQARYDLPAFQAVDTVDKMFPNNKYVFKIEGE